MVSEYSAKVSSEQVSLTAPLKSPSTNFWEILKDHFSVFMKVWHFLEASKEWKTEFKYYYCYYYY